MSETTQTERVAFDKDDPRHQNFRAFMARYFDLLAEGRAANTTDILAIARDNLPGLAEASDEDVRNTIRYIGANFFRIIGIKQPRTAKRYHQVLDDFRESLRSEDSIL